MQTTLIVMYMHTRVHMHIQYGIIANTCLDSAWSILTFLAWLASSSPVACIPTGTTCGISGLGGRLAGGLSSLDMGT